MEMKPCPFCGRAGELNKQVKSRTENIKKKELADKLVEIAKETGLFATKQKRTVVNDFGEKSDGWSVFYQYWMFRPRCSNKRCIANNMSMFYSDEDRAISAWNKREGE